MFRGRFEYTIDEKGRLPIPARLREVLVGHYNDERLVVTNYDDCLWAYPLLIWQELEKKVGTLPQFLEEVKALQRVFMSAACECAIDKQGRILIPPLLRTYAALEKEIVVVGMTQRLEIWSKKRWDAKFVDAQKQLESMQEKLAELGI